MANRLLILGVFILGMAVASSICIVFYTLKIDAIVAGFNKQGNIVAGVENQAIPEQIKGDVVKVVQVERRSEKQEKQAVRKWLQENHPDPDTIEEIAWHFGFLDSFPKDGGAASASQDNNATHYHNGQRYAFLKMRHSNGFVKQVESIYYVLDDNNEVDTVFERIGSYDNPHEKRSKPEPNPALEQAIAEMDLVRQKAAEAQKRHGQR